jgi:hypothetical protein
MDHARRRAPRYQLIVEAELTEMQSKTRLKARTSDVSMIGCFMNSARSLPQGTEIQLQIAKAGSTFQSLGIVAWSHPMGMGIEFISLRRDQEKVLQKWISDLSVPSS